MSELTVAQPKPHTDAEYQAAIEELLTEIDNRQNKIQQDQARIQRLKTETQIIKAETSVIKARTQARLDALDRIV